jgi:hypothetical protein
VDCDEVGYTAITKYLGLGTLKVFVFTFSSQFWTFKSMHWQLLSSGERLMVGGITMVEVHAKERFKGGGELTYKPFFFIIRIYLLCREDSL